MNQHHYSLKVTWTGNNGTGTSWYRAYDRSHTVSIKDKPDLECSSDAAFRGDVTKYTPEDLLVASVSGCHMLWYLHLCAEAGIVVTDYTDRAEGTMEVEADGGGKFTVITLHPMVTITDPQKVETANGLHHRANQLCFIARSCNFPILHQPQCKISNG
jgi:organic hydroperoxide reductase OsmC/OhrA